MQILVFIKQIPEISRIEFDPATNRIVRDKVPLIINPFDKRALEEGLRIREKFGGEVTAVSMGPPSAITILNDSLKMGADRAILLSDPLFSGSDTLITSEVLGAVVTKLRPEIVLMGKYSLDGETSQVPPEVAVIAGYGFKTSVSKIDFHEDGTILLEQEREDGLSRYHLTLPLLVSVSEKINRARAIKPDAPDRTLDVEKWTSADLGIEIKGSDSPTVVESTERIDSQRKVRMLDSVDEILEVIREGSNIQANDKELPSVETPDSNNAEIAVGVSVGNIRTGFEIASKLSELGRNNSLRAVVIGDTAPGEIQDLPCNEYVYVKGASSDVLSSFIVQYIEQNRPRFIVFPSNVTGREISASVAARLRLGLTADCIDLKVENGNLIQYKPAFGGGLVARITSRTSPQMATVRPGIFHRGRSDKPFEVRTVDLSNHGQDTLVSFETVPSEYAPLQGARFVVGIGRGIVKKENVPLALEVASRLGGAVGGTRPVVDLGWLPRQQQVGLTGYSISPELYIATGLSGNDNHVVGIRYAKTVIAVNKDPDAPIFRHADFGLVADSVQFLQDILKKLPEAHSSN